MEIYALIGSSGTGKSHHAMELAEEYQISYIIDDGLLIRDGKKLAGQSAKAEPTMVAAVKRAIFLDPQHASVMRETLVRENPKKLLILGTSEHMIDRIILALSLPPLKQAIFIQDVSSHEDIALAREMRRDGKHVIPLSAVEVRKEFPTVWMDPLVGLFRRKSKKEQGEKTIIRPAFSQLGQVFVSEQVVIQLVQHVVQQDELLGGNSKIGVKMTDLGILIQCELRIRYGTPIQRKIMQFQEAVVEEIERLTGLPVRKVDVRVSDIFS